MLEIILLIGFGTTFIKMMNMKNEISNMSERIERMEGKTTSTVFQSESIRQKTLDDLTTSLSNDEQKRNRELLLEEPEEFVPPEENTEDIYERPPPAENYFNEKFLLTRALPFTGIVLLVLGISYFIKYSFDHNWIPPIARIILGFFTGIVGTGVGLKLSEKYKTYSEIIVGGSLLIMLVSTYAGYNFYQLYDALFGYALIAIISIASALIAQKMYSKIIITLSIITSYLIPYLIPAEGGDIFLLFNFFIVLNSIYIFLVWKNNWLPILFGNSVLGSLFMTSYFHSNGSIEYAKAMVIFGIFFLLWNIPLIIQAMQRKFQEKDLFTWIGNMCYLAVFFIAISLSLISHLQSDIFTYGVFFLFLALYYGGITTFFLQRAEETTTEIRIPIKNTLLAITLAISATILPSEFLENQEVLPLIFILESIAFGVVWYLRKTTILRVFYFLTLAIASFFMFTEAAPLLDQTAFFNFSFFKYLLLAGSYLLGFYAEKNQFKEASKEKDQAVPSALILISTLLFSFSIFRDIGVFDNGSLWFYFFLSWLSLLIVAMYFLGKNTYFSYGILGILGIMLFLFFTSLFQYEYQTYPVLNLSFLQILTFIAVVSYLLQNKIVGDQQFQGIQNILLLALILIIFTGFTKEISFAFEKKQYTLNQELRAQEKIFYSEKNNDLLPQEEKAKIQENFTREKSAFSTKRDNIENWKNGSISIFWMLYSVMLLVIGFMRNSINLRKVGGALIVLTIGKIFFYDLTSLTGITKIISFIVLGLIILAVSFYAQKIITTLFHEENNK